MTSLTPPLYKTSSGTPHSVAELLQQCSQGFAANPAWYPPNGHNGYDWGCPTGTQIYAMHDGEAKLVQKGYTGYGIYMTVTGSGFLTYYAHLKEMVKEGPVKAGDLIALSNNTGNSTGPHLHVTVKRVNAQGVILDSGNGYDGAFNFASLLVWKEPNNQSMFKLVKVPGTKEVWISKGGKRTHVYNAAALTAVAEFSSIELISQLELDALVDSGLELAALIKE